MRVFRDLDLVEHLGSGVHRILRAYCRDIFHISDIFFEISFPFEKDYLESVNKKKNTEQDSDTDTPQVTDSVTEQVKKLILVIGNKELNSGSIRNTLKMTHRNTFLKTTFTQLLSKD